MGRPRKQTVDYFPHFVSTDSRTRFILEQSWGNDGYAFWFKLLELLCRSEGHYYDLSEAANGKYLEALMKVDGETSMAILNTLADLGSIDRDLWEERKVVWCQSLVDNLQDVYSKRTVSAPVRPFTEGQPEEAPEQEFHEEIEAGCVIRSEPAAGTVLKEGDLVTLYVSKGPEIIYSTMVSCLGETVESVQDKMSSLNLLAEFTKVESSEPEGTVLSQSIETGEEVPEGTTVTFTYSEGPKLISYPITFDVPYSEDPVLVQIFLDREIVFDQEVPGNYGTLSLTLQAEAGDHKLEIYAANKLFWDEEIQFQ